jgi:hypothetical protein
MQDITADAKREIAFFMEKAFQVTFGYIAVLAGLVAAFSFDIYPALAAQWGFSQAFVFSLLVLVSSTIYLATAWSCLFAVLKRGYYIMVSSEREPETDGIGGLWELFVRDYRDFNLARNKPNSRRVSRFVWNFDNYYMVPIHGVVGLAALCSGVVAVVEAGSPLRTLSTVIVALVLVLIPGVAGSALRKMDRLCRDEVEALRIAYSHLESS